MTDSTALKTPLFSLHEELGGKIVDFAGYALPVQYSAGILKEHLHCRAKAALFDVSHMGQVRLTGSGAQDLLESLTPVDGAALQSNQQRYSFFTNTQGGILDDLMIARLGEEDFFLVVNAACKSADFAHLQSAAPGGLSLTLHEDKALLALQGPAASAVLARLLPGCETLAFMALAQFDYQGVPIQISRSGYSGEDGYEISLPNESAESFARALLAHEEVEPAGLGARDSLRLEAGLCLYGHDIDETTSPVEAGLTWAISKRRRAEGGYPGSAIVQMQLAEGVRRKRVGILPDGRAPIREGVLLCDSDGQKIGQVTSGGFGPSFGAPVAMGYVAKDFASAGEALCAEVRGKHLPVSVAKLPFVKQNYYRG